MYDDLQSEQIFPFRSFCTALTTQFTAFADDVRVDAVQPAKYPTPENRAFEAGRDAAGLAYFSCLAQAFGRNAQLSVGDAQSGCAEPAKEYAQFLPADVADQTLLLLAYRVKDKP